MKTSELHPHFVAIDPYISLEHGIRFRVYGHKFLMCRCFFLVLLQVLLFFSNMHELCERSPSFWEKLKQASKPTIPLSIGSAWPISSITHRRTLSHEPCISCGEFFLKKKSHLFKS